MSEKHVKTLVISVTAIALMAVVLIAFFNPPKVPAAPTEASISREEQSSETASAEKESSSAAESTAETVPEATEESTVPSSSEEAPESSAPESSSEETAASTAENKPTEPAPPVTPPSGNVPDLTGVDYSKYLPVPEGYPVQPASAQSVSSFGGIYKKNSDQKVIYLTFCLGSEVGYTDQILNVLKSKGVQALFLVVANEYPRSSGRGVSGRTMLSRMVNEGHLVGSHGFVHVYSSSLSDKGFVNDVVQAERALQQVLGSSYHLRYYRPPGGSATTRDYYLAQKMGLTTVMYSFNYRDFDDYGFLQNTSKSKALAALKSGLAPGSVYYLHVTECNVEALPDFIDWARGQGYTFLRIDQDPGGLSANPPAPVPVTEPTSSEAESSSSEAEPSSSEAEQSSSEAEPASSETEPASSETEPFSSETEPASSETEPASSEAEQSSFETEHSSSEAEPSSEAEQSSSETEGSGDIL